MTVCRGPDGPKDRGNTPPDVVSRPLEYIVLGMDYTHPLPPLHVVLGTDPTSQQATMQAVSFKCPFSAVGGPFGEITRATDMIRMHASRPFQ